MKKTRRLGWGNLMVGLVLITTGMIFLLDQFLEQRLMEFIWPLFIIVPGLILFSFVLTQGKGGASGLAVPASILTVLGSLLFYQNITGHWESWAYAWSLIFPFSIGFGLYIAGVRIGSDSQRSVGLGMIKVGLWIFIVGGVFFELILGISDVNFIRFFWPSVIILLGVFLILRQMGLLASKKLESIDVGVEPTVDEYPTEEGMLDEDAEDASTA